MGKLPRLLSQSGNPKAYSTLQCFNNIPHQNTTPHTTTVQEKKYVVPQKQPITMGSQNLRRKEVIQPHLPVRLPCYDLVPIANLTLDGSPRKTVRPPASGVAHFHDLTGGVYKARERIHRSVADLRLLATPPSRSRVAGSDPN